jgi:glycine cleavage system H lipoate-binding protein
MSAYWPGSNTIKSTNNAFNWRKVRFGVSEEMVRHMGRVVQGIENAKKGKKFKKGEVVLVTPKSAPVQLFMKAKGNKK